MEFSSCKIIVLILSAIKLPTFITGLCSKIELNCKFVNYGWDEIGKTCDLENSTGISIVDKFSSFKFMGLSEDQKNSITSIIFRRPDISFIPKETFLEFPKLNRICFHGVKFQKLDVGFFRYFPKDHGIETFDFSDCEIKMIDPRTWEHLKKANRILMSGNLCANSTIKNVLKSEFLQCFENFQEAAKKVDEKVEIPGNLGGVIEALYDRIDCLENSIRENSRIFEARFFKIEKSLATIFQKSIADQGDAGNLRKTLKFV